MSFVKVITSKLSIARIAAPKTILTSCYCTDVEHQIQIPNRIHRGPTDILQALESTVQRDYTAAHYKYHDDPYLTPMSNLGKRTFAMAQEAGRKAAHWVRKENADLFQHREAEPMIKAFVPPKIYTENSDVCEEDLINAIKDVQVADSTLIYKLLKNKNVDISHGTLQQLLELICFYNCEEPLGEEFIEERWFKQSARGKERQRKTWKDGSFAEEVFISFENPGAEAYSAIIQGMAKYGQIDRSAQLFEEAQNKGLVLSADTFNAIISVSDFLKEGYDHRWKFILETLSLMSMAKVKPNLGTLNSVLKILSTMGTGKVVKQHVLRTLSEFRALGIEPSLASWYYVLISFCKERGPVSPILRNIMAELNGKEFKIRDSRDTFFFVTAMDVCHHHLCDKELAKQVDNLLHLHNNYDLIGDSYKESIYYRHYITLLCKTEPLEDFMENVYQKLVPNIYVPEPSVMLDILKYVEANDAINYLPRLWSDIVIFDHANRENILTLILNIMINNGNREAQIVEKLSNVAWDIWSKVEYQQEHRTKVLSFTGDMLGKIMTLTLRNNDFEKASKVMDKLENNQQSVLGVPQFETLKLYVDHCIQQKRPSSGIDCLQYAVDSGFEQASELAASLIKHLTLDETHLQRISSLVGQAVLTENSVTEV
ncbi:hypothetical protein PPYR_04390 [Photinus pyralis]|uniref:Small ribosomal subunit protein mS39 n=1 Tax=Photinus pyralis TaxID=7054 RepID=A0A1Y1LFU0_PHOPY|nr:protein PTCD3 homolog, mitochondrial [Photinus pyralis]KAB0802204.1 hypothetical protein PPYR_04390 [Photinus pyralis]